MRGWESSGDDWARGQWRILTEASGRPGRVSVVLEENGVPLRGFLHDAVRGREAVLELARFAERLEASRAPPDPDTADLVPPVEQVRPE